ncbi:MAG: Hsp33 family molecular chaperone HslO, partial [Kiloniellaceae bacterium]
CVQHYFRQSEQIRTGLTVAAARVDGAWRAAGLILQRTPGADAAEDGESEAAREDWRRAMILQATCTSEELLDPSLRIDDLLYRLFHEEGVRVFRRRGFAARCRCSRARLEETLRALPRADVEGMRRDGEVVMTCQFCNTAYRFDEAALARLYSS